MSLPGLVRNAAWGLALSLVAAAAQAERLAAPPAPAPIEIQGAATPLTLDTAALRALPSATHTGEIHGTTASWTGATMIEVLRRAGAPVDDKLRGKALNEVVRFHAADGYSVTFSLAEFDPKFGDNGAFLAYVRDGKPMDANEGPFRLIVPGDVRAARSVRQVVRIELRSVP